MIVPPHTDLAKPVGGSALRAQGRRQLDNAPVSLPPPYVDERLMEAAIPTSSKRKPTHLSIAVASCFLMCLATWVLVTLQLNVSKTEVVD